MSISSKHTEGKLSYIESGMNQYILQINGADLFKSFASVPSSQQLPNAARIVTTWNNWDNVILALNNLIDAAQGNNEYECDTTLQNAVEMAKGVLPVE